MGTRRVVRRLLSAEEARAFCRLSALHGWRALATSWGLIALCFWTSALWPRWWVWTVAVVLLGGRQLALAILMHEAAHRTLLPGPGGGRGARLNDWVGRWLCAAPTWNHLGPYRAHHQRHHRDTGAVTDPDLALVTPFPTTPASLARKFTRDLLGLAGIRRVFALLAMDLGMLRYTPSAGARPLDDPPRGAAQVSLAVSRLGPVLVTNLCLWCCLAACGHSGLYWLWVVAYLSPYSLFMRVRSMAEHACTAPAGTDLASDPLRNTRTTLAGLFARLTVAPHRVNYHLEHHLLMGVPHHKLPHLHALLLERGALKAAPVAPGYLGVLRRVGSGLAGPSLHRQGG